MIFCFVSRRGAGRNHVDSIAGNCARSPKLQVEYLFPPQTHCSNDLPTTYQHGDSLVCCYLALQGSFGCTWILSPLLSNFSRVVCICFQFVLYSAGKEFVRRLRPYSRQNVLPMQTLHPCGLTRKRKIIYQAAILGSNNTPTKISIAITDRTHPCTS